MLTGYNGGHIGNEHAVTAGRIAGGKNIAARNPVAWPGWLSITSGCSAEADGIAVLQKFILF